MSRIPFRATAATALLALALAPASAAPPDEAELRRFAAAVADRHDLDAAALHATLREAEHDPHALERLQAPAEALSWQRYRALFLTEERLEAGLAYAAEHTEPLAQVAAEYGVARSVLLAILGVESSYGARRGDHRVLDALTTLGFSEHRRAGFFRDELASFLVLSAEHGWDASELKGSYAGALGKPQFIPSSYRAYAVDQDGDGRRDLLDSAADALGSAAHYLREHGWQPGGPVAVQVRATGQAWRAALAELDRPVAPEHTVDELRQLGVRTPPGLDPQTPAALIELAGADGPELWLTFRNFHALTRYNHSARYAMAVHQLARALAQELPS